MFNCKNENKSLYFDFFCFFDIIFPMKTLNLEQGNYTVDHALIMVEIEIENAKREGIVAIKIVHGYGSHGVGGAILLALRKKLLQWKRSGFIKDYFFGDKWNLFDRDAKRILERDKSIFGDKDFYTNNPGITIIEI